MGYVITNFDYKGGDVISSPILDFQTISQKIVGSLRDQLLTGKIKPGEKITIRKLAETYGVSTMPIREALMKLEAEGFVTISRRSIIVTKLTEKDVREIFSIRKRLEKLAVEWLIPNIKSSHLASFDQLLQEMDQQIDNHFEWRRMNKTFHLKLYSYSGSKPLLELLSRLWGRVEVYMNMYTSTHYISIAQEEHYKILEFINNNDKSGLLDLLEQHIDATCEAIIKQMTTKH